MEDKKVRALAPRTVSVQENELIKTDLKSKYPQWKLKICKWLRVEVADEYDYCYRIRYTSNNTKLSANDVILNSEGRAFVVLKEMNRIAVIVTPKASVKPPYVMGTFRILQKPKSQRLLPTP